MGRARETQVYSYQFDPPDELELKLRLHPATDPRRRWVTAREHSFHSAVVHSRVPAGFRLDLASVPPWLHWLYRVDGTHQRACLHHDWLYHSQPCRRVEADALLLAMLLHDGVARGRAWAIYLAVRLFGGQAWRANR